MANNLENMYAYEFQSGIYTSSLVSARERYTNPQKTRSIKNTTEYWRRFNYSNVSGANTVKPLAKLNLNLSCKLQQWLCVRLFESETIMLKHTRENCICGFVSSSLKSGKQRLWRTDRQTRYSYISIVYIQSSLVITMEPAISEPR